MPTEVTCGGNCVVCPLKNFCRYANVMNFNDMWNKFSKRWIRRAPYTWGSEVETEDDIASELDKLGISHWYDGSGPLEFSMPPLANYMFWPADIYKKFVDMNIPRPVSDDEEMGCHLHMAGLPVRSLNDKVIDSWRRLILSAIYHMPLLSPLLSMVYDDGYKTRFRRRAYHWVENRDEGILDFLKGNYNIIEDYGGREYSYITFNRKDKSALTLEIRLSEAIGLKAFSFQFLTSMMAELNEFIIPIVDNNRAKIDPRSIDLYVSNASKIRKAYENFGRTFTIEDIEHFAILVYNHYLEILMKLLRGPHTARVWANYKGFVLYQPNGNGYEPTLMFKSPYEALKYMLDKYASAYRRKTLYTNIAVDFVASWLLPRYARKDTFQVTTIVDDWRWLENNHPVYLKTRGLSKVMSKPHIHIVLPDPVYI